jgi:hypothetical protein
MHADLINAYRYRRQTQKPGRVPYRVKGENGFAQTAFALAQNDVAKGTKRYPVDTSHSPVARSVSDQSETYVEVARVGLRYVGRVEADCGGRNGIWDKREASGWFTDPAGDHARDGTGLCWGVVYQLPGRKGESRYVSGYIMGGCSDNNPVLDLRSIETTPRADLSSFDNNPQDQEGARQAARNADSMAQRAAEAERDYQAAWQAGSQWCELGAEIEEARGKALALLAERRTVKGADKPAICAAIRDKVESCLQTISEARATRAALAKGECLSDYMPGFWPGDRRLREAFNEGANAAVI